MLAGVECRMRLDPRPVLCNPDGIVLSDIRQVVLTNPESFYLSVPSCRVLSRDSRREIISRRESRLQRCTIDCSVPFRLR